MSCLGFSQCGNPQGKPLVLIHGWGCDGRFLKPIADMFPERCSILIDLPGYGKSVHLTHLVEDFQSTIHYLINTLPAQCDVISWSFGTLYALHLATLCSANLGTSEPETAYSLDRKSLPKIDSLVTICGSARFPSDPNWEGMSSYRILKCNTALTPRRLKMILNMFYNMQTYAAYKQHKAHGNLKGLSSSAASKTDDLMQDKTLATNAVEQSTYNHISSYIESLVHSQQEIDPHVLMHGIRLVTYLDERPALRHLTIPSLHLFGEKDHLVPANVAYHFNHPPLHKVYTFKESAHTPYLSEPELFSKVVHSFYQNLSAELTL